MDDEMLELFLIHNLGALIGYLILGIPLSFLTFTIESKWLKYGLIIYTVFIFALMLIAMLFWSIYLAELGNELS